MHNVELKAQAALTRSFLETACHPQFIQSLFHSSLFRYHVLGDTAIPDPGFPPFYPKEFFAKIREVHLTSTLNVCTMTQKQWYNLLLEDCCTMEIGDGGQRQYIRSRVELATNEVDWEKCWRLARLHGLGPEHTSFLFRLLHQILPTQERLNRAKSVATPLCKAPGCSGAEVDNLEHSLVECNANQEVGMKLLDILRQYQPNLSTAAALRLDIEVDEELELPLVWLTAATLVSIWDQKKDRTRVQPHLTRSQLEAKVNLLRETRLSRMAILDSVQYGHSAHTVDQ